MAPTRFACRVGRRAETFAGTRQLQDAATGQPLLADWASISQNSSMAILCPLCPHPRPTLSSTTGHRGIGQPYKSLAECPTTRCAVTCRAHGLRAVVCIPVAVRRQELSRAEQRVLVYKYVFSLLKHPFPPMLHERLLWLAGFACCPVSSLQPSLFGPYALERAAGRQAGVRFDCGLRRRSGSVACAVSDAPSTAAGTAEPPVR